MNLEEQTVNGIGEIHLQDALNASLLKIVVKCTSETVLPADNDLIIYVDKMTSSLSTSSRKQFVFSLEDKLRFYNNISDEFILTFNVVNNDIKMKGIVNQKIEYENSNYSILENSINYEVEGFPITLFEGENYIYTNYENASISLIYPKNNDENKLFLNSAIYYNHNEKQDGEFSLDDIYFKDCFTKTEDKMNLEVNNLKVDCITSNNNKFSLDQNGNLTVNSIYNNEGNIALKNLFEYSNEESIVGKWIDGKKIYRKVVSFIPTARNYSYNHGINDIKDILPMSSAILQRINGQYVPFSLYYYPAPDIWGIGCQFIRDKIEIWLGNNMFNQIDESGNGVIVILYYTKNND